MKYITITEDEFIEKYQPLPNHIDIHAAWDLGHGGLLYDHIGKELEYIKSVFEKTPRNIWTLVDDNCGRPTIISGAYIINRLGYIVTKNPFDEDESITVEPDEEEEDEVGQEYD